MDFTELNILAAVEELTSQYEPRLESSHEQPFPDTGEYEEKRENHVRTEMGKWAAYAEAGTAFDPSGKYLCATCHERLEPDSCMWVSGKIDMDCGSCRLYVHGPEQQATKKAPQQLTQIESQYSERREEPCAFGCQRCEYGSKAKKPDSDGRENWCGFFGVHILPLACCSMFDSPDMVQAPGEEQKDVNASGTSEGAEKGWDTRGRGRKELTLAPEAPLKDKPIALVFGGSFNPPHVGHVGAAKDAADLLSNAGYYVGKILIAPTADKLLQAKLKDKTYPLAERVALSKLTFPPEMEVVSGPAEEAEDYQGKLRRTQLADWVQQRYPDHTVVNVTGEDQAPGHPPGYPSLYEGDKGSNHEGYYYLAVPRPAGGLSSTKIRDSIHEGKQPEGMVPEEFDYLKKMLWQHPEVRATGTSEGAEKGWDSRGRGRKEPIDYRTETGVHVGIFDRPESGKEAGTIPIESIFNHPPPAEEERKKIAEEFNGAVKVGEKELNVNDIIPMQKTLTEARLTRWRSREERGLNPLSPAAIFHRGDNYYLMDGHHRIGDEILKGTKMLKMTEFALPVHVSAAMLRIDAAVAELLAMNKPWWNPELRMGTEDIEAYGTSEGVTKEWDTRGRGKLWRPEQPILDKKAPIETHGWLLLDGRFAPLIGLRGGTHEQTAKNLGYKDGYSDAYNKGLIRVSTDKDGTFFESAKSYPEVADLLKNAISRIPPENLQNTNANVGSGSTYQLMKWDGNSWTRRLFVSADEREVSAIGTSEGAEKGWDIRGRGRQIEDKMKITFGVEHIPAGSSGFIFRDGKSVAGRTHLALWKAAGGPGSEAGFPLNSINEWMRGVRAVRVVNLQGEVSFQAHGKPNKSQLEEMKHLATGRLVVFWDVDGKTGNSSSFSEFESALKEDKHAEGYDSSFHRAELQANYKLDYRTQFRGLGISIENRKGSIRKGVGKDGTPWETKMLFPYGYIRMTEGVDGDHVDTFLGDNENAENVYVVHVKDPKTGAFDEDKCFCGFDSAEEAKKAFLANYDDPKFFGGMETIPFEKFKEKVLATKDEPQRIAAVGTIEGLDIESAITDLLAFGTSEGVEKSWDTRGRGRKTSEKSTVRFYHGTISNAMKKVLEEGLHQSEQTRFISYDSERNGMASDKGYIFVTKQKYIAQWFAMLKAKYAATPPGGDIVFPDPKGDCCFIMKKSPEQEKLAEDKAAVLTLDVPKEDAQKFEDDPSSSPTWEDFRLEGTLPKDYISKIEVLDGMKEPASWEKLVGSEGNPEVTFGDLGMPIGLPTGRWRQVWDTKTKILKAGETEQLHFVWFGKLDDLKALLEKQDSKDLQAEALFRGVKVLGFTGPEEEFVNATMSRVPPELLTNVKAIISAPWLGAKHGRYLPDTKIIYLNPKNARARARVGEGPGWIQHGMLTTIHEIMHSVYDNLPESVKDQWMELSGWMVGWKPGQAGAYEEKRPGWEPEKSKWTHKDRIKFPRIYSEKNPDEDFADSGAFYLLGKAHQIDSKKKEFLNKLFSSVVKNYPKYGVESPEEPYGERHLLWEMKAQELDLDSVAELLGFGTSEGVTKSWDTRGRGREEHSPEVETRTIDELKKEAAEVLKQWNDKKEEIAKQFMNTYELSSSVDLDIESAVDELLSYGTSEGVSKAWDTRGRGRKQESSNLLSGIRTATHEDAATFLDWSKMESVKINERFEDAKHLAEKIGEYLWDDPEDVYLATSKKHGVVGAIELNRRAYAVTKAQPNPPMEIFRLVVNPRIISGEMEEKGTGTRLMVQAAKLAAQNKQGIELTAFEGARTFYEKLGMHKRNFTTYYWTPGEVEAFAKHGAKYTH